jgi:hypothetical protein
LLLELGFTSPLTRHFEHAAEALGLRYKRVLLGEDGRGVGARNVSLPAVGVDEVEAAAAVWVPAILNEWSGDQRVRVDAHGTASVS